MKFDETLISTLPDPVSTILRNAAEGKSQDAEQLSAAYGVYFDNFYRRKQPKSNDIALSESQMGTNVYEYMWGASEFYVSGTLKDYDRTNDLKNIDVPTLYITGEFDAAMPNTVKYYQSLTPGSRFVEIKNAGHLTMHDNPAEDIKAISGFLNELDNQ